MPDICMCQQEDCNDKLRCYRYVAPTDGLWQSYFSEDPREKDGTCKYFMVCEHPKMKGKKK